MKCKNRIKINKAINQGKLSENNRIYGFCMEEPSKHSHEIGSRVKQHFLQWYVKDKKIKMSEKVLI